MAERILITGGAGFIGSHLCEKLLNEGNQVVCLDNFNNYYDPRIKEDNLQTCLGNNSFSLYKGDILDRDLLSKIFDQEKISKIVHLAARAGVRPSIEQPSLYEEVNILGTQNLLEEAVKHNISQFIFASSSSVYGTNKKIPFSEEDSIKNQISPYAKTKKQGEILCKKYSNEFGLDVTCLRFFTVYGPRGRPDMASYKFVEKIMQGHQIEIYCSEEDFKKGNMARDFTFIEDIVKGISSSLNKKYSFEIFNLGRGEPVDLREFINIIEDKLGRESKKVFIGRQKGDVSLTYSNIEKSRSLLGYNPSTSLKEGISEFVNWFQTK